MRTQCCGLGFTARLASGRATIHQFTPPTYRDVVMPSVAPSACLPDDLDDALLIGRVWRPAPVDGPSVIGVRRGEAFDITSNRPTTADLFDRDDAVDVARHASGASLGAGIDIMPES